LHLGHFGFSSDEITYKKQPGQPMRVMTLFIIGLFVSLGVVSSVGRESEISVVKSDVYDSEDDEEELLKSMDDGSINLIKKKKKYKQMLL